MLHFTIINKDKRGAADTVIDALLSGVTALQHASPVGLSVVQVLYVHVSYATRSLAHSLTPYSRMPRSPSRQSFAGMGPTQLDKLMDFLCHPCCQTWAINIGECPQYGVDNVTSEAWKTFAKRLPNTQISFMFVEPRHAGMHLCKEMKAKIKVNRTKYKLHDLKRNPERRAIVQQCDKMFFHPMRMKVNSALFNPILTLF